MNIENSVSSFGERLQEATQRKKITQKALAKIVKRTEHTVSRWVRKGIIPNHDTIAKIAKACDISQLWLEKGIGPKNIEAVWAYHARQKKFNLNELHMLYDRINEVLTAKNINKEQLSALADIEISRDSEWWLGNGNAIVPSTWTIEKIANATGYSKEWLWYGRAPKTNKHPQKTNKKKSGEIAATLGHWKPNKKQIEIKGAPPAATEINLAEGLRMTETVLLSNTSYADAIWANLKSFTKAVETEKNMIKMEEKITRMEKKLEQKMEKIEELLLSMGAAVPEKRDKEANS